MITIEELSQGLKDYLNTLGLTEEQVRSLMLSMIGNTGDLQTENKDSIVNAINENKTSISSLSSEVDSLKLSVSNGKELIANAITDKGVETLASGTFAEMASNINSLSTMKDVLVDGVPIGKEFELNFIGYYWSNTSTDLLYYFYEGSAVVYNNELHILGGTGGSTKHYKYDGSSWTSVSTLPYKFYQSSAVVYNNELHILGGNNSSTNHYKYDGSSWTSVSTLPYNFYRGSAVVYNNEIHILGGSNGSNYTKHYKYNGKSWSSVSTLPYNFYQGSAVVYNNEIHILGSNNSSYNKYYCSGFNNYKLREEMNNYV